MITNLIVFIVILELFLFMDALGKMKEGLLTFGIINGTVLVVSAILCSLLAIVK